MTIRKEIGHEFGIKDYFNRFAVNLNGHGEESTPSNLVARSWNNSIHLYRKLLFKGYKFRENIHLDNVDERSDIYEAEGLEVEICETTIDICGNIVPDKYLFAVFARKPNEDIGSDEK